ncbi:MAG: endolytic transglycosylase MltG [Clostridia bacterium]|nr:endolytic transglycosylase MltG [Clostridia bacterium]
MSKNIKNIILMSLVLAFILLSVEFLGIGRKTDVMVEIPKESSVTDVCEILSENNLIGNPFLFKVYSVLTGRTYFPGQFHIEKAGYPNLADVFSTPPAEQTVNVTFYEGIELREICDRLVDLKLCTKEEFYKYAVKDYYDYEFLEGIPERKENPLEGYLFPDTYNFSYSEGAQSIINKMLANFKVKIVDVYGPDIQAQNCSLDDIIIMASIVEREAADKKELSKISGVFYNRLNRIGESVGLLESCATVQYVLKERKAVLSLTDTKIDSPYNTYKYQGLPIGPISCPGADAIKAAIFPEKTNYLYFVADGNGKHYFAETLLGHEQNKRKAGI